MVESSDLIQITFCICISFYFWAYILLLSKKVVSNLLSIEDEFSVLVSLSYFDLYDSINLVTSMVWYLVIFKGVYLHLCKPSMLLCSVLLHFIIFLTINGFVEMQEWDCFNWSPWMLLSIIWIVAWSIFSDWGYCYSVFIFVKFYWNHLSVAICQKYQYSFVCDIDNWSKLKNAFVIHIILRRKCYFKPFLISIFNTWLHIN